MRAHSCSHRKRCLQHSVVDPEIRQDRLDFRHCGLMLLLTQKNVDEQESQPAITRTSFADPDSG